MAAARKLPIGVRAVIYSYESLPGLLNKIGKLSKRDRQYLLDTELLDQDRALRFKFWVREGAEPDPLGNINMLQLEYAFRLSSRVELYIYEMTSALKSSLQTILGCGQQFPEKFTHSTIHINFDDDRFTSDHVQHFLNVAQDFQTLIKFSQLKMLTQSGIGHSNTAEIQKRFSALMGM